MKYEDMIVGVRYIVTKESDDTTFRVNDVIILEQNGDIYSPGLGWITSDCLSVSVVGMEIKLDKEYAISLIEKSEKLIVSLKENYRV